MSEIVRHQSASGALLLVTVAHRSARADMAVPPSVPLVEMLPGMVRSLDLLKSGAATRGFAVRTADGRVLDLARPLADQRVASGAVLTLEPLDAAAGSQRYDDLVEAIGSSVEQTRTPWRRSDAVALSTFAASGLLTVAAALMVLRGHGSLLGALVLLVGAALVAGTAAVVARIPLLGSALTLSLTVPLLAAAAGYALFAPGGVASGLVAAGIGAALGCAGVLVLPRNLQSAMAAPATVSAGLVLLGLLAGWAGAGMVRSAALVVALLTLAVLMAPWIGLAQMPVRVDALTLSRHDAFDQRLVADQVRVGQTLALSLRIAAGLVIVALAPVVAREPLGAALMVAVGLAHLLTTRSLHGRAEVFAGALTGMLTLVLTGIALTTARPHLLGVTVVVATTVAVLELAINVVSARMRPGLTRAADALHVVALLAVLPLVGALWWGLA